MRAVFDNLKKERESLKHENKHLKAQNQHIKKQNEHLLTVVNKMITIVNEDHSIKQKINLLSTFDYDTSSSTHNVNRSRSDLPNTMNSNTNTNISTPQVNVTDVSIPPIINTNTNTNANSINIIHNTNRISIADGIQIILPVLVDEQSNVSKAKAIARKWPPNKYRTQDCQQSTESQESNSLRMVYSNYPGTRSALAARDEERQKRNDLLNRCAKIKKTNKDNEDIEIIVIE